ncbi:glycosyltransferase family 4 protein [Actinophytocola sp.]|uniref:glycosyltransferase family 4 protein n=1 Tax=Actinophytocola sp. TaxID=1872138 RepID=UPI0025C3A709|nr:glycosyltransferase family 4 protein [Actinophytocola sp.]
MGREHSTPPAVLFVNWRDTAHPEGGGSEHYVERMAEGLVRRGYRVTIQCAAHADAPADEVVAGVRFRRRGTRFTVYLWALIAVARMHADVIVDVQAGMPFFSRLVARCPVLVLVHHVHREQWPAVLGPVLGRIGWWIESRVAPLLYRNCRYLTVSDETRRELAGLGIATSRTTVVRNGLDTPPPVHAEADPDPVLVVVGRVVPHKRVEHAVDVVARLARQWPKLRLEVVGHGWWLDNLRRHIEQRDVGDRVTLHGFVEEQDKHEILARSWVHLCPSVKEGWGIVIMEAAAHGVPSVAYRRAGGVTESIVDGRTGLLAEDFDDLVRQVDRLLASRSLRSSLGSAGQDRALSFAWERSVGEFEAVLVETAGLGHV